MLFLNNFTRISQNLISFLGWQSLYVSILFAFIWLLTKIFKKIPPVWQSSMWMLILIRFIIPVDFSAAWSIRALLGQMSICVIQLYHFFMTSSSELFFFNGTSLVEGEGTFSPGDLTINLFTTPSLGLNLVFWIWLIGVLIFLCTFIKQRIRFKRFIKEAEWVREARILNLIQIWRLDFRIARPVRVVTSSRFLSPFTSGIFRPIIFIPEVILLSENSTLVESIIAHEMAHIKRWDDFWIILQNFLQILYFFHPVIWLTNSRILLFRECLCDSMVLSRKKITLNSYGQGIINIIRLNLFGTDGIVMSGFGSRKKKIVYRIKNLNGGYTMKKSQLLLKYLVIMISGLLILPMASPVLKSAEISGLKYSNNITADNQSDVEKTEKVKNQQDTAIKFELPLSIGKISARYGMMKYPDSEKVGMHTGIDIAAPLDTEIYAVAAGNVIIVNDKFEENRGPGKEILIQHANGFQTRYTHLNMILVKKDQVIKAGEIIARVGSTGRSTGPHLHFEIRLNDKPENPENYINFNDLKDSR